MLDILATHKKKNVETLSTKYIDYGEYTIQIELREYDLYERFLVFRNTSSRQGIRIRAFSVNPETYEPPIGALIPITEKNYGWRKDNCGSWRTNIDYGVDEIKERLDERQNYVDKFTDTVEHYRKCRHD